MAQQDNEPGSWVTIQRGFFTGTKAKVVGLVSEERDGAPVPDGLEYFHLRGDGIPEGLVFRRDELTFHR